MTARHVTLVLRAVAFVALVTAGVTLAATPAEDASPAGEVRGFWVVRTSLRSPESIDALVRAATAAGVNTLLVQVRGRGEAYYRSDIEPRAADLAGQPASFDPLRAVLDRAKPAGLRVHAWVNINLVANSSALPSSAQHVVRRHPEWLMVPRALAESSLRSRSPRVPSYLSELARWTQGASDRVEGLYLSPVTPEARAYSVSIVRELAARYDLDGIHLDYVRYPGVDFDYSQATLREFRAVQAPKLQEPERERLDCAAMRDPAIWTRTFPLTFEAFRRERLTSLVADIRHAVSSERPGLTLSAAVFPSPDTARARRFQDWAGWAASGYLDAVCPMTYTTDPNEFESLLSTARLAVHDTPLWAGIGAYLLPAERTAENVRIARQVGANGVLFFSYDSMVSASSAATDYLTTLRPTLLDAGSE